VKALPYMNTDNSRRGETKAGVARLYGEGHGARPTRVYTL